MHKWFLVLSSLSALVAVGLGAFGAHGLRGRLDEHMMAVYQTAVQYHFWHALGLGLIAILVKLYPDAALLHWAGGLMFAGIIIFSGSLYILSIGGINWLGAVTPLGGTAFLMAWLLVTIFAFRIVK